MDSFLSFSLFALGALVKAAFPEGIHTFLVQVRDHRSRGYTGGVRGAETIFLLKVKAGAKTEGTAGVGRTSHGHLHFVILLSDLQGSGLEASRYTNTICGAGFPY